MGGGTTMKTLLLSEAELELLSDLIMDAFEKDGDMEYYQNLYSIDEKIRILFKDDK